MTFDQFLDYLTSKLVFVDTDAEFASESIEELADNYDIEDFPLNFQVSIMLPFSVTVNLQDDEYVYS